MLFTSEQVSAGHPDKICDQISDAIVTDCLKHDRNSRVAVEAMIKDDHVYVAGEITSKHEPNISCLVRNVLLFTEPELYESFKLETQISKQSGDIALGVDKKCAGDQGMMFGYATNETRKMLPMPFVLATEAIEGLDIPPGHFRVYGYHWEGDTLVPTPEEAVIVKRIFQNFLDGKSRLETEREFAAEGITTRDGCRWVDSNIKSVLCNVTYTGNLLLQKEFTADPISKKKKKNRGELPQYFVPNTHEAIIDKETFDYVQSEMTRRRELGPLANKALNTSFLTGKIKCAFCGQSYMHSQRLNRAKRTLQPEKMETWACGSRKKKGGRCIGKEIPHRIILQEAASAMGLEAFDEQAFTERIDHIEVTGARELTFHFRDGHTDIRHWVNTSKKDCWTSEYRAEVSAYRRQHAPNRNGCSCFTTKLKCTVCGENFRRQMQHLASVENETVYYWRCPHPTQCGTRGIRDKELRQATAEVLGLETFDETFFLEQIDHIDVNAEMILTYVFKDGHTVERKWDTKRHMPKWSAERRTQFECQPKRTYSPEQRKRMSEHMKEVRRNKYWSSKGKS